jgi:hypothetical protein
MYAFIAVLILVVLAFFVSTWFLLGIVFVVGLALFMRDTPHYMYEQHDDKWPMRRDDDENLFI